jgi:hypothetical protein
MANNAWQFANPLSGYNNPITEEVILNVPGVRLVGVAPSGTVGVVWMPVTPAGAGTCITVTACDCLIEGFSFQGGVVGGRAISAVWDGATAFADNLIVRHCLFDQAIGIGIQMDFTYLVEIHDCIFLNLTGQAIYVDPAGTATSQLNIHDNWFMDCAAGAIIVSETTESLIARNYIYNSAAQGGAAATGLGIDTSAGGGQNLVMDNYLSCPLAVGYADFCSGDATDAWIDNHTMTGPTITIP